MILAILFVIIALAVLYFGADWLVRGSSSLAVRAGITPLVVGLTVVAFGTSAPELCVSIKSALSGAGSIAVGNVVGSNIFNVCAILGIAAIIYPLKVKHQLIRSDMPVLIVATLALCAFWYNGVITCWGGILFLVTIILYTIFCIYKAKRGKTIDKQEEIKVSKYILIDIFLMALGVGMLILGSTLLVDNATIIAHALGWSDAVIGLTIVAAGTSMPELATSVVAALKKRTDIAIGNVVGSNIFNILMVLGATSAISPITTSQISLVDICMMTITTFLMLLFMRSGFKIDRREGIILFISYIAYTIYLIINV